MEKPSKVKEPLQVQEPQWPPRQPATIQAVTEHLLHGDWVRLEGAPELERDLAAFHADDLQGRPPIPWFIASGTAALMALLLGHGIGPGDEVITTPLTWAAPTSAILAVGATPVFADVDDESGLIDPQTIPALMSERTKAILVVHLFGSVCDMQSLRSIADHHGAVI